MGPRPDRGGDPVDHRLDLVEAAGERGVERLGADERRAGDDGDDRVVVGELLAALLAFLFGTNTVMCIFLPMAAARGVKDVSTALKAVRVSSGFFVLSCLITLATHDTVGWVTIALVWLGHVTVTGAELYLSAASWTFQCPRRR